MEVSTNDILKRLIYVYEFSDNSCYIGLTYNIKNRNRQHLESNKSPVFNYIKKLRLNKQNLNFLKPSFLNHN